jgi:hypothetical protein
MPFMPSRKTRYRSGHNKSIRWLDLRLLSLPLRDGRNRRSRSTPIIRSSLPIAIDRGSVILERVPPKKLRIARRRGAEIVELMPPDPPAVLARRALADRRYAVLASLASERVTAPVALAASAPVVSMRHGGELTTSVSFDPGAGAFVATSREGAHRRVVFVGPSLTLACSAANAALQALAPLESLIRARENHCYRRTRPQYLQEVHFADALRTLGQWAGADLD